MEIVVALVLLAVSALVVFDSYRLGAQVGRRRPAVGLLPVLHRPPARHREPRDAGPRSSIAEWRRADQFRGAVCVAGAPVRRLWPVEARACRCSCPPCVYVLGVQLVGIYVASAVYITLFMRWLGHYSWVKSVRDRRRRQRVDLRHVRGLVQGSAVQGRLRRARLARLLSAPLSDSHSPAGPGGNPLVEISALFHGFAVVLSPFNLLLMMIGIVLGVIIGVLPGLGGANGVAILLPLTFTMPPTSAIIMLSCIYWGALFGGAITSVLFNIPGEPWSVATTFDGYPMAQQGRAGRGADGLVHLVVHRRAVRGDHDHVPRAARREVRAQVRAAGILLRLPAHLLQLHRHGQGLGVEDARGDDARLRARRGRHGQHHRPAAPHLRLPGDDARRRLPDRRDRALRHRRDPAVDGGGPVVHRQVGEDRSEGRARDVEEAARATGSRRCAAASSAAGWGSRPAARRPRRS